MPRIGELAHHCRTLLRLRGLTVFDLLALVAVATGVALVFASQIVHASFERSSWTLDYQLVGSPRYQLDSRGPAGTSGALLYQAQQLPGVQLALPYVEQPIDVVAPSGRQQLLLLIGIEPRLAHLGGNPLQELTRSEIPRHETIALPAHVAVDLGVKAPSTVYVRSGSRLVRTRLAALLNEREMGPLARGPVALAPLEDDQLITGLEKDVSRIFVQVEPGHAEEARAGLERLAAQTHVNLDPASFDSELFAEAVRPLRRGTTLLTTLYTLLGVALALGGVLGVSSGRATAQAGLPNGISEPRRSLAAVHAVVLTALACACGLALGDLLSVVTFSPSVGYMPSAFLVDNERVITWQCVGYAVGAGLFAVLAQMFVRSFGSPQTAWRLRLGGLLAVGALGMFAIVVIAGVRDNLRHGVGARALGIDAAADVWLTPRGEPTTMATASFASIDEQQLYSLDGVQSVDAYRGGFLDWGKRRLLVAAPAEMGANPLAASQIVGVPAASALAKLRAGGWALASRSIIAEHGLRVGQPFTLPTPQPASFRLAGTVTDLGWPSGAVVLNANDYARAWGNEEASAIEIRVAPGADPAAVSRAATTSLGAASGLQAETEKEREGHAEELLSDGLLPLGQLFWLSFAVAALMIAVAVASAIWRVWLRAGSESARQARRLPLSSSMRPELVWLVAGCLLGAVAGFGGQELVSSLLADDTGLSLVVGIDVAVALYALLAVGEIALIMAVTLLLVNYGRVSRARSSAHTHSRL